MACSIQAQILDIFYYCAWKEIRFSRLIFHFLWKPLQLTRHIEQCRPMVNLHEHVNYIQLKSKEIRRKCMSCTHADVACTRLISMQILLARIWWRERVCVLSRHKLGKRCYISAKPSVRTVANVRSYDAVAISIAVADVWSLTDLWWRGVAPSGHSVPCVNS